MRNSGASPKVPDFIDVMAARFPLQGKTVVDVGSGTGISTFKLAQYAAQVIGIEIEEAMIALARKTAQGARHTRTSALNSATQSTCPLRTTR